MDPITIVSLLAQFAPTIMKAIGVGSDIQKVANAAAAVATEVTGKADITDAVTAMQADPALAAAFNTKLLEQQTEFESLYIADKKDARARDAILQATPKGNVRANWLVGIAVIVILAILGVVVFVPTVSEYAKGVLTAVLGLYLQQLGNIYSFEFGTTRRSREKSDVIDAIKGA